MNYLKVSCLMVLLGLTACTQFSVENTPAKLSGIAPHTQSTQQPVVADMEHLLKQRGCHACHDREQFRLGPPYIAVSMRYVGQREAMTEVLAQKIRHGGGGAWGIVPMVANEQVGSAEARLMAQWILALTAQE